jgi:hypothetical protein
MSVVTPESDRLMQRPDDFELRNEVPMNFCIRDLEARQFDHLFVLRFGSEADIRRRRHSPPKQHLRSRWPIF